MARGTGYWWLVLFFFIVTVPLLFYWPQVAPYRHTIQLPVGAPGALSSDLWKWDFVREGCYAFVYLIVCSGLFMVFVNNPWAVKVHGVVLVVFIAWTIVMGVFDIDAITHANVPPADSSFRIYNPARSLEYCCLYGLSPGTERLCANTATCTPTGGALTINYQFLVRVILNGALLIYLLADMVYTISFYGNLTREQDAELNFNAKDITEMVRARKYTGRRTRYDIYTPYK